MAKPKLALIPATQGSKLYSVLPADGVGDFDFSRGSAATRINKDGLIETVASGVSRLNYPLIDGVVNGCPSHLLEPSRTNLIPYSEDFSNASWSKSNSTITPNSTISPSGVLNASKYTATNAANYLQEITSAPNGSYVFSIFAKKIDLDIIKINLSDGVTGEVRAYFNLSNETIEVTKSGGTITNWDANFEKYGNGWYKININAQTNSGSNITTYLESESLLGSFYIYGAQLEQGPYPTSYIPNYGTSAGITRSAETANGAGDASTFNDSEGVLMAEISALSADSVDRRIAISDGTTSNRMFFYYVPNTDQVSAIIVSSGSTQANIPILGIQAKNNKLAIKYKVNDVSFWVNGFEIGTDTVATMPSNLSEFAFDDGGGGNDFYGKAKQIQYFDSALNDSDLETLTSWVSFSDMANGQLYSIK